jgi:hypothetical protein
MFAYPIGREQITPHPHPAFLMSLHSALFFFIGLCLCASGFSLSRGQLREK